MQAGSMASSDSVILGGSEGTEEYRPDCISHQRDDAEDEVIAQVDHPSPPARIHAAEAEQCERLRWETSVEALISAANTTANPIMILTFGRNPPAFDAALDASHLVQPVVSAGGEVRPSWANGAKILTPEFTQEMWQAVGMQVTLKPCHVIIHSEDIPELEQVMQGLSYPDRPRPKPNKPPAPLATDAHTLFQDLSSDGAGSAANLSSDVLEFVAPASSCSASVSNCARDSWLANLREWVLSAEIVHLNVSRTFVEDPAASPPATPRSGQVTSSAPGALGPVCQELSELANPRIWGSQ